MDLKKMLEPKTCSFIEKIQAASAKPIYDLSPKEARDVLRSIQKTDAALPFAKLENITIQISPSRHVSVTIVRPSQGTDLLPIVMYFHGGGWVMGDNNTHDRLLREVAHVSQAAIVFVNYTPSPEAQYPTSIEEAYAATDYFAKNAKAHQLDGTRLAVMGDSVGGNMAIAVTLLAKERSGPKICYQVLFYPVTDADFEKLSYQQFAEGPWLTKKAMEWFWHHYLPDVNKREQILACPLRASLEELKGLPPALIINAECDVLRDEGEAYARLLNQAGVMVTALRYLGTIHDFVLLNAISTAPACKDAIAKAGMHLREAFNTTK